MTFGVIVLSLPQGVPRCRPRRSGTVRVRVNRVLLLEIAGVSAAMIVFFFRGWPVPKVAIVAGALLLITRRVKPEKVYHEIDWSLLVLFAGLFIVVAGVEKTSLEAELVALAAQYHLDPSGYSRPFRRCSPTSSATCRPCWCSGPSSRTCEDPQRGWLVLAMSSTLAGNLTILGSVANLIVVQRARREAPISFWQYFRVGAPLTVLTLIAGALWLSWLR